MSSAKRDAAPSTSTDSNVTSSSTGNDANSIDIATKRNFSCGICFESYTRNARYPISLGCGHTFCVLCIRELSKCKPYIMCGICRKHTMSNYKRLGKNFILMDLLERSGLLEEDPKDLPADPSTPSAAAQLDSLEEFGDTHGSTLGISNAEMEDLYNTVENINDHLYGYMRSGRTPVATSTRIQELEELRSDMDAIEASLTRERRNFREIYNRARAMLAELRRSSTPGDLDDAPAAGPPPVPLALRRAADAFSRAGGWPHAFYDEVDLFDNDLPTISISLPEVDRDDRLTENFVRRENNNYFCYLCDVRFFNTPTSISQHVNGRRHRDLLAANENTNVSNWEIDLADLVLDNAPDPFRGTFSQSARSRQSLPTLRNLDRVEVVDLPRNSPRGSTTNNNGNSTPLLPNAAADALPLSGGNAVNSGHAQATLAASASTTVSRTQPSNNNNRNPIGAWRRQQTSNIPSVFEDDEWNPTFGTAHGLFTDDFYTHPSYPYR